jgi:NAD(P)H dehydrogenase (quinone)
MLIAVTGANGGFGRAAIASLLRRVPKESIVALVRDPAKAADLGVAVRQADYDHPHTLAKALAGVDRLLLISGTDVGQRIRQHSNVVAAAQEAGVKFVAYTSILHADNGPQPLAAEHQATEKELRESGIPSAFLRNGWYFENYAGSIGGAVHTGAVVGSAGNGRVSAAPRGDYAEAAAIVVSAEKPASATYELAGDNAFTMPEFAAEIGRQLGRPITYSDLPVDAYAKVLESIGLPPPAAKVYAALDTEVARGILFDDSRTLSRILGRPTGALADFVAATLKASAAA